MLWYIFFANLLLFCSWLHMQIKHLACSNIYNFNFKSDLRIPHHGVNFDITPDTSDIHIVIWSSWSGKSQFFKILRQIWSYIWYHPIDCDLTMMTDLSRKNQTIRNHANPFVRDTFHHHDLPGTLITQVHLGNVDLVKLNRLNQHIDEINILIQTYSTMQLLLTPYQWPLIDREYVTLQYEIDYKSQAVYPAQLDNFATFVWQYLTHYNLIKQCIVLHNRINPHDPRNHREDIFDYISGMRDADIIALTQMAHTGQIPQDLNPDIVASLYIAGLVVSSRSWSSTYYPQIYHDIVYYLDTYLDLHMNLHMDDDQMYHLTFVNRRKQKLRFDQLSSSDQACVVMILSLIGSLTKFGILILEEPEVHLHPQYQIVFSQLLHDLSKAYHLQIILNTNSSLMINETTIDNVFRLFATDQGIHIVNPTIVEEGNEARLSQILSFTNSAKIFFVDTIILVEGETDEYFFKKYFRDLNLKAGHHKLLNTFQIININGKGSLKMWVDFLTKFQIQYRFIGDRDNIVEIGIDINIGKYLHQAKKHRGYISKSEQYDQVIYQIQTQSPKLRDKILHAIWQAKKRHILILSQGDFESYLWLQDKWLDVTISWIQSQYPHRLQDYRFASARRELEEIHSLIFSR